MKKALIPALLLIVGSVVLGGDGVPGAAGDLLVSPP